MVTKAKKALLASLAAFLCVMLTVFGLSMSFSLSETAKAADETSAVAQVGTTTYKTLNGAIGAAAEGDTVTLLKDTTEDVVINKNITLDLDGKTLTGTKTSGKASLTVVKGATATVKNGTILGTENGYYTIQNNGTATFETLTATAGNTGSSMIDNWGTLTITSGTYTGGLNVVKSEEGSVLTINGGEFTLSYSKKWDFNAVILVYGDTTIKGGTFIQNAKTASSYPQVVMTGVVDGYASVTKITGGTFINNFSGIKSGIFWALGDATSANFKVSGGTFNKAISADYCAEGFIPSTKKNADGMYGVKEGKYVAQIGSKKYETLADAIRLAAKGKTVTLLDNISGNFEISDNKIITLDLNGFTLNGGTGNKNAAILNHGTLTITDSSAKKTGTIKREDNGIVGETSYYVIRNLGTMTIEQANVVNNSGYEQTNPSGSMIGSSLICNGDNDEGATLTIKGGKLTQTNFLAIKNGANGTLFVNGGEITSNHSAIQNWYNATITGGTIKGQLWTDAYKAGESVGNTKIGGNVQFEGEIVMDVWGSISPKPELTINGGKLSVTNWRITSACAELGGKPAVQGGTFTSAVPAEYCADRFIPTKNADGTYGVKACVAKVGSTKYETLAEAIAAAESGDTITLLADITNTDYTVANVINIKLAEGVTLDGNNHTLSGNVKITVASAGGVTIKNVKFKDIHNAAVVSDAYKTKYGFSDDKVGTLSAIYASNLNGSLTVTGCEFENVDWDAMQITPATGAEVVIKNNIFKVSESETVKEQLRHVHVEMAYGGGVDYEGTDIVLTVTDNQFIAETKEASLGVWWVGKDSTLDLTGNYYADPDSASITLSDKSFNRENRVDLIYPARSTADVDEDNLTATVMLIKDAFNSATYSTLAEAIAAAKDGETVKLLADITENGMDIAKSITIDFDGHTLTVEGKMVGSSGTVTNALRFLKNGDTTNTVVLKNGKIVSTTARILIQNYSSLTVDGMVLDLSGQQLYGYVLSNNNGNTVIKDTTISAPAAERSLAFDVCGLSTYGDVSVTMEGNCVINGNVMFSTDNPENKQNVELILNGGIINGSLVDGGGSEDIIIRKSDNVDIAAPAGYFWNSEGVLKIAVAKIGEKNYATLQEAFDAAKTGDIVKLLTDITLTAQVNITKALNGLTLDGNGKTITCATTTDVFTSGGSALYFGNATDKLYCTGIKIKDLTMTGKARFAIFLCGGTTTEFTNVNISGEYYIAVNLYGTHGATMTNCTISNSTIDTDKYISGVWSNVASANPLRLVSTTVDVIAINAYTTANTLAPKIFIDKNSSAEVHTFDDGSVSYNKKLCVSTESEGSYTVKEYFNSEWVDTYVAEVKGVKFATLQEAIDAAERNATVTLLANTKENVTIAKALTLDLNGYTINGGKEKGKPAVTVTQRIVTIKDSSEAQTGTIMREDTAENSGVSSHYVIDVQGNGWLKFESGNVINHSGVVGVTGASLVRVGDDSVAKKYPGLVINGGTFTQDNFIVIKVDHGYFTLNGGTLNSANSYAIENWFRATVNDGTVNGTVSSWTYSGGSNSTLEILGGTINGDVTSVNYGNATDKKAKVSVTSGIINGELDTRAYDPKTNKLTSINDAAKATIEVSGGTFSADPTKYVVEASAITKNTDGTYGVEKAYLAKIGETSYYTMEEAFEAQKTGETIVLLRDYTTASTFNSGSIDRVVDLHRHTWTYTGTRMNDAAFKINNPNVTLTVKNGTIISNSLVGVIPSAVSEMDGTIIAYDNAGLVFDGVAMTSNGGSGIETNGNNTNDSVTLKNSTLNVSNGFGIYFPSSGTLTIDNSTINAKTMGVQVCSGELNINAGSAINVTGDSVPKAENDGAIQDGAAISIVNRTGYKGLSNIVITGGTFTAKAGNDAIKAYDWANKVESEFTKADLVAVSGGTFSSEVKKDYLANGFRLTKTGESYGVTAKYIESTHVSLGTALSFSYKLRVLNEGETIKNAKASYRTVRGNLVEINMTLVDGCYVFDGITPQMLDRKISVNVYVGDTVVYDVVDYSILDYLQEVFNLDLGKATVTKQLVADLAFYGKAAMKYVGYETTVVDKFIADNGLTQSTGEMTGLATSEGTVKVANVSVQFASQNKILIGVAESVFNDYSYTIKVNGTEIDRALWQTDVVDGYRVYVSEGFAARYITDASKYVEVEVLKNETSVQKVQCNVAGYCMKMAKNEKMGELATATYYYGVSAAKYANFKG